MSDEVMWRTAQRIAEHATLHGLHTVQVVLHGGEPLLAGADRMRRIITSFTPLCAASASWTCGSIRTVSS